MYYTFSVLLNDMKNRKCKVDGNKIFAEKGNDKLLRDFADLVKSNNVLRFLIHARLNDDNRVFTHYLSRLDTG